MYTNKERGTRFQDAREVYNRHGRQSMREVSDMCGVSFSLISDLENYDTFRSVGYDKIIALAEHYGVSTDYLLGLSDCPSVSADIQVAQKTIGLSIRALDSLVYIHDRTNSNDDTYSSYMAILNSLFGKKGTIIALLREIKYAKDEIARIRDEVLSKIKMIDITDLQIYQKSLRHIQRDVSELVEHSLGPITGSSTLQTMITNRIKELEEANDGETE